MKDENIYIDDPIFGKGSQNFSHMSCSNIAKLHEFAQSIGVKKCWFENKRTINRPHYDVNKKYFQTALTSGAIHLNWREFSLKMNELFGEIRNPMKDKQKKLF